MSEQAKVRIGRLDTVGGVVKAMGRVYRQARRAEIEVERAGKLVYMLTQMRAALEVVSLEDRIAALEARRDEDGS